MGIEQSHALRRLLPAAAAVALIAGGLSVASPALAASNSSAAQIEVTWKNVETWQTGFQSSVDVKNKSGAKWNDWKIAFQYGNTATSVWNAVEATPATPGTFVVSGPGWQQSLAVGEQTNFGLTSTKVAGASLLPTSCTVIGANIPCALNGGSATPGTGAPTPTPTPAAGGVNVTWENTSTWTTGGQTAVQVKNTSTATVSPWQIRFTYPGTVKSIWDATATATADGFTATAPNYSKTLSPGGTTSFGLSYLTVTGSGQYPTACTVLGLPAGQNVACTVNSSAIITEPGTNPTEPTEPSEPFPTPASDSILFAPYVDMGLWPTADLVSFAKRTGASAFNLAFIVSNNTGDACSPTWAGYNEYKIGGSGDFHDTITAFQEAGGTAAISFGGLVNDELALRCTDATQLQAAYQQVIDRFGVSRIDFDIEGQALTDTAANARRASVVAALVQAEAAKGHELEVTLTLPVMPTGLTSEGIAVVQSFAHAGVPLTAVNVMAMDYGLGQQPMGQAAQDAVTSTAAQLATIPAYATWTTQQRMSMIGVTPMIGLNDTGEIFTLDDAQQLGQWAVEQGIEELSYWEATRDRPCTAGLGAYECSGVSEQPWAFAQAFVTGIKQA